MILYKGSKQLLLKFGYLHGIDCIQEHQNVINNLGYVWFGKIGIRPKSSIIDKMLDSELKSNFIILKSAKECYLCHFDKYSLISPENGFPEYYISHLRMTSDTFSIWFRITEMKKISDLTSLQEIVVESSGNPLLVACRQSMAAHFFTIANKDIEVV